MLSWPRELVIARLVDWQPDVPGQDAGATLGGVPQRVFTSGGPVWKLTLGGLIMRGRNAILAGRALQAELVGGRPILVRPCDCRQAPLAAGASFTASEPSAGAPFDDVTETDDILATAGAAALRAVSLTLAMVSGYRALIGGEQFSIDHATWGRRMYRIGKVTGGTAAAPIVSIRPPLREAISAGTAVDFNRPGCVMRLDGRFQIDHTVPNRLHTGQVSFCELERPPTGAEL